MAFPSLDHVIGQLQAIVEEHDVTADSKIADLDVDSLDLMEWMFEIESAAKITVDESVYEPDVLASATVRDVYERIKQAVVRVDVPRTGGPSIPSRRELTELLGDVSLFSRCTRRERATVARHMSTASLPVGTPLVEEGEEGDAFFVIIEGAAKVERGGRQLVDVGPGASFGELALLDGEPRSASVIATADVSVAVLGVRMFRTLLREFPEMAIQLMAGLAGDVRRARDELAEATRDQTE